MIRALAFALVAAAACGSPVKSTAPPPPKPNKPAPKPPDPVLFLPGERIDWSVTWMDVNAAEFSLSVGEPDPARAGRRIVDVETTAASTGLLARVGPNLRGSATTTIDLDTGVPLAVAGTFDDVYSGDVLRGESRDIKTPVPWDAKLPGGETAHDTHSGLGKLRAFRPAGPGQSMRYYGRIRGYTWSVDAVAGAIETIETAGGPKRARKLSCEISPVNDDLSPATWDRPYPFDIWISEDDYRVPLRIRVDSRLGGVVVFDVKKYAQPPESAQRSARLVDDRRGDL